MDSDIFFEFRVQYRLKGSSVVSRSNFVTSGTKELMSVLARDGVTRETVEHMYIHQLLPDGQVAEVVAIEPHRPLVTAGAVVPESTNVVSISVARNKKERRAERKRLEKERKQEAAKRKPHVKMKTLGSSTASPVHTLFYTAVPL